MRTVDATGPVDSVDGMPAHPDHKSLGQLLGTSRHFESLALELPTAPTAPANGVNWSNKGGSVLDVVGGSVSGVA